jgi:hypothetical protein
MPKDIRCKEGGYYKARVDKAKPCAASAPKKYSLRRYSLYNIYYSTQYN